MDETSKLSKVLGPIPLLLGVYTKGKNDPLTVEQMVDEIKFLNRVVGGMGATGVGVYLENSCRTRDGFRKVQEAAGYNISAYLDVKVGVTVLPDTSGSDNYAFEIARRRTLPFIVRDIIAGHHRLDKELGGDLLCAMNDQSYKMLIGKCPGLVVIGGVAPPYSTLLDKSLEEQVALAGTRSDAMMVKAMKKPEGGFESDVPVERIDQYREWSRKPVILASSVKPGNIKNYIQLVDGFIVGSGARKDGLLHEPSIRAMVEIVTDERKRRAVVYT